MTIQERLISLIGFAPPQNSVEGALLDEGLNAADAYDPSLSLQVKKATIQVMEVLLTTADTTNENQYVIKYDRPTLLKRITALKDEVAAEDGVVLQPVIRSKKCW